MSGRSLRVSRFLMALALTVMILAGCSDPARDRVPAGEGPQVGGSLRVLVGADPASINPWQYSSGVDRHLLFGVYDPIIELDLRTQQLRPAIAKAWRMADDGRTATLTLQEGVVFHDGSTLAAWDVVYSIEQAMDPKASRTSGLLDAVIAVEATDAETVTIRLARPDRELFWTLSDVLVAKRGTAEQISDWPMGTGPFVFASWSRGQRLLIRRNVEYWRTGQPYLDEVSFLIASDQTSALLQLENGQADIMDQVSFAQIAQARNSGLLLHYPSNDLPVGLYEIFLNTRRAPFADARVRQALDAAIDRPRLAQVLQGVYAVRSNPLPGTSPSFARDAPNYPEPDLDRARTLLFDAGYRDGLDAGTLYVYSNQGLDYVLAAQVIQDSAAKAGIRMSIRQLDVASWADQVLSRLDYNLALGSAVSKPTDFDRIAHTWAKALGAATGWAQQCPEFYDRLNAARAARTDTEYRDRLRELDLIGMQGVPVIVVGGRMVPVATGRNIGGFVASSQGYLLLREVWIQR